MKRLLSALLMVCMLGTSLTASAAAAEPDSAVLRVGLYYGSTALAAPQLQNEQGSGYIAGYYDTDKVFHGLLSISATKLVMLKDGNYTKASNNTYAEATSGTPTVGAYHVQTGKTYATESEAAAAASAAGGFAAYGADGYHVRIGSYATQAAAQAAVKSGQTVVGASTTGITVVQTDTGKILFEYDGGSLFAVAPQAAQDVAPVTWFKGYRYYGNFAYPRTAGSNLSVINYVDIEDYVKGVIPYEMSPSWSVEALKAQAVCARSYAEGNRNKHGKYGFDVCATTDCQVYHGCNTATANSDSAVDQTAGQYVTVDGKPVTLFFFASDGGATESSENVWGGALSYLKGVTDPYEDTAKATNGIWTVQLTAGEVAAKVQKAGYTIGTVTDVAVTKLTDVGNVLEITVTDADGKTVVLEKSKCRSVFGLNSQRYTVTGNGTAGGSGSGDSGSSGGSSGTPADIGSSILSGAKSVYGSVSVSAQSSDAAGTSTAFTFSGRGWGHQVGMSQCGAKAMAEQGMTYDQILKFYFTGIEIVKSE